jgi:hypothetical protein
MQLNEGIGGSHIKSKPKPKPKKKSIPNKSIFDVIGKPSSHHSSSVKTNNTHSGHMGITYKKPTTKKKTTSHPSSVHHTTSKPLTKAQAYHSAVSSHSSSHGHTSAAPTTHHSSSSVKKSVKPTTHTTVHKPIVKPKPLPKISSHDLQWYNTYGGTITNGNANTANYQHYMNLQKKYGLKGYTTSSSALHNISIKALSGDKNAQAYLKALNIKQQTGSALWKGVTNAQLDANKNLGHAYRVANPNTAYTKGFDNKIYGTYNTAILGNKQMTDDQVNNYHRIVDKYHLDDMTDPYQQQIYKTNQDKQTALNAQTVASNQSLAQMDASNFQQFQQLQQNQSDRGITDTGIAAGGLAQAQMGNAQAYSQAYSDSATNRANITQQYDNQAYGIKQDQIKFHADQQAEAAKQNAANAQNQIDLINAQTTQDKYLTSSTGYVYLNGKKLTSGGKAITSIEYKKLSETQRHNLASENNVSVKNAQDYNLGTDRNAIARQKVAADLKQSIIKNQLDYAKLDYNYAKLDATNKYNQSKLKLAISSAQTSKDKSQLTALGKQATTLTSQITAAQRQGKKPSKSIVAKYNETMNAISKIVGGTSFSKSVGGGGSDKAYASYGGYKTFKKNFSSSGVDPKWFDLMAEIVKRESGFNPNAQNPTSSAHGYGQFLTQTRLNYEKKLGLNYDNPVDQITMMAEYIKDRYKTPANALKFWKEHNWY